MHLSTALVAGTFALTSSAFLIPPEVPKIDTASDISALWAAALDGKYNLELDCAECPFAGIEAEGAQWEQGVENKIKLEFSIEENRTPYLNGRRMVPDFTNARQSYSLSAPQIRASDGQLTRPLNLDFILEGFEISRSEPDKQLHPFNFTIVALEGHPVKVDTVKIDLLYSEHGITIVKMDRIPFEETPGASSCDEASKWSLCRFRAFVAARMEWLMSSAKTHAEGAKDAAKGWFGRPKGCKGRPGFRPHGPPGTHGPPGEHGHAPWGDRPHHHGPPGFHHGGMPWGGRPDGENAPESEEGNEEHEHHHHHMHGHHRVAMFIRGLFQWLIIPAMLGVIGGILASAIGMLVGQLIVFLWVRFARRGQRGTASNIRVVEVVVEDDEKDGLLVGEDEQLPVYEDVETVIVEDEKN